MSRYALLFLILLVPGICLVSAGGTSLTSDVFTQAHHEIGFNDSDFTALRNDFTAFLIEQNPALNSSHIFATSDTGQAYPHASTRKLYDFARSNLTRFSSSFSIFITGLVLLVIGLFALAAAAVDLASQSFEERALELFGSLRAALARHLWKILLLYILYSIVVGSVDAILSILPDGAAGALSGLVLITQIYIILRFAVTIPALVSEELGPFPALARSWQLTHRSGWKIFGASVIFGIILFAGVTMLGLVMQFVFSDVLTWENDFLTKDHLTLTWFLTGLPGFIRGAAIELSIVMLIVLGLLPVFGTVLYYDLRTRKDGPLMYLDEHPMN